MSLRRVWRRSRVCWQVPLRALHIPKAPCANGAEESRAQSRRCWRMMGRARCGHVAAGGGWHGARTGRGLGWFAANERFLGAHCRVLVGIGFSFMFSGQNGALFREGTGQHRVCASARSSKWTGEDMRASVFACSRSSAGLPPQLPCLLLPLPPSGQTAFLDPFQALASLL